MKRLSAWQAILATTILFSATAAHAAATTLVPGGKGDDTALLQAALAQCTNAAKPCDLHLAQGVFYTDVLLVSGFVGSISGAGQTKTIIRPLAGKALRSSSKPFFGEPTLQKPYPVLIHFANDSKVSIANLTLDFPKSMRVRPYDFYLSHESGIGINDSLLAAVLVDGANDARLAMTSVAIRARDNDTFYGSNLWNAVRFEGQLRFSGGDSNGYGATDLTRKLKHGSFVARNNLIDRTGNGLSVEDTNHTDALITGNELDSRIYAVLLTNPGASKLSVVDNIIRAELEGIFVAQTPERPPQDRSTYLLARNTININETGLALDTSGYDGIAVFDFAVYEDPPRGETVKASVDIFDNDITIADNAVLNGITISGDAPGGDIRAIGNRVYGTPIDSGIFVDYSRGTLVVNNDLSQVKNPGVADVHLTATTHACRVIEPDDSVRNEGTNNQVTGAH